MSRVFQGRPENYAGNERAAQRITVSPAALRRYDTPLKEPGVALHKDGQLLAVLTRDLAISIADTIIDSLEYEHEGTN